MPWAKVLQLLVVNRLIDPGSELRLHRQWFLHSAMDELLGVDYAVAGKDRLYRCLDRILAHKEAFCQSGGPALEDAVRPSFDVLLYDLTSTYFEGSCRADPQGQTRLQPRRPGRLPAGGHRAGGDAGRVAPGL